MGFLFKAEWKQMNLQNNVRKDSKAQKVRRNTVKTEPTISRCII